MGSADLEGRKLWPRQDNRLRFYKVHAGFSTGAYVVRFVAAVEIIAWTIYFVWKTLGKRSRWRVSSKINSGMQAY